MSNIQRNEKVMEYIVKRLGNNPGVVLDVLAEEAAELAQAALKAKRALGLSPDNPTDKPADQALRDLEEEATDVCLALSVLEEMRLPYMEQPGSFWPKLTRWAKRLGYKEEA